MARYSNLASNVPPDWRALCQPLDWHTMASQRCFAAPSDDSTGLSDAPTLPYYAAIRYPPSTERADGPPTTRRPGSSAFEKGFVCVASVSLVTPPLLFDYSSSVFPRNVPEVEKQPGMQIQSHGPIIIIIASPVPRRKGSFCRIIAYLPSRPVPSFAVRPSI